MGSFFHACTVLISNRKAILSQAARGGLRVALVCLRAMPIFKRPVTYFLKKFPSLNTRLYMFARTNRPLQKKNYQVALGQEDEVNVLHHHFQKDPDGRKAAEEVADLLKQAGVIYYWIEHTVHFPKNTGIQRVARQLARSLMELGAKPIPVRWDHGQGCFAKASRTDLDYLSQWNGPNPDAWEDLPHVIDTIENGWLIIPEVIYYMDEEEIKHLQAYARSKGLKTACIYFDALPITLSYLFSPHYSAIHLEYMLGLRYFDLILGISAYSALEFRRFHAEVPEDVPNQEIKIEPCILPGEFLEAKRVTQIKENEEDICRILCVSTAEARKNHINLLLACEEVILRSKRKFELILVGRPSDIKIDQLILKYTSKYPNIHWEQDANDTRLYELYRLCDFTIYPSLAEGFGLPVLESLWNGRPCICRNTGALGEVALGGGCLVVDTTDVRALVEGMIWLIEDDSFRKELAVEAISRQFKTWQEYGIDVLTQLADQSALKQQMKISRK